MKSIAVCKEEHKHQQLLYRVNSTLVTMSVTLLSWVYCLGTAPQTLITNFFCENCLRELLQVKICCHMLKDSFLLYWAAFLEDAQFHSVRPLWMAKAEMFLLPESLSAADASSEGQCPVVKQGPICMAKCVQTCVWGDQDKPPPLWVCTWKCPDQLISGKWLQNVVIPEIPLVFQDWSSERQRDAWIWWRVDT